MSDEEAVRTLERADERKLFSRESSNRPNPEKRHKRRRKRQTLQEWYAENPD